MLVGIDDYPAAGGFPMLSFATNDASELRDVLRDEFGFDVVYIPNKDAKASAIRDAFEALRKRVTSEDAVLFFFAGHGTPEGKLVTVDARASDLKHTGLDVEWLRDALAALPARHKAVILDSCYSGRLFQRSPSLFIPSSLELAGRAEARTRDGAGTSGAAPDALAPARDYLSYYYSEPAFLGISAGRLTPVADGEGANRHSLFTANLLRVLRDRADSARTDHAFTFRQLATQVEFRVGAAAATLTGQIPLWGYLSPGVGDLVLRPIGPSADRPTPTERLEASRRRATPLTALSVQWRFRNVPEDLRRALKTADTLVDDEMNQYNDLFQVNPGLSWPAMRAKLVRQRILVPWLNVLANEKFRRDPVIALFPLVSDDAAVLPIGRLPPSADSAASLDIAAGVALEEEDDLRVLTNRTRSCEFNSSAYVDRNDVVIGWEIPAECMASAVDRVASDVALTAAFPQKMTISLLAEIVKLPLLPQNLAHRDYWFESDYSGLVAAPEGFRADSVLIMRPNSDESLETTYAVRLVQRDGLRMGGDSMEWNDHSQKCIKAKWEGTRIR